MSVRYFIAVWKYRVGYFGGFLTAFAAILIVANTVQDKLSLFNVDVSYFVLLPLVTFLFLLCAWLLDFFKIPDSEIDFGNSKNNMLKEIYKK